MPDALAGLYQQVILDHAKARTGDGPLDGADAEHYERNPTCGDEITVRVVLGRGAAEATVWTCDLSHEYVSINADYRS